MGEFLHTKYISSSHLFPVTLLLTVLTSRIGDSYHSAKHEYIVLLLGSLLEGFLIEAGLTFILLINSEQ